MKKFSMLGVALFAALIMVGVSSQAGAVTLGKYAKGLLVPTTVHQNGVDTVVGIICSENTTVYWTFFGVDSNPIVDDQIPCTKHELIKFSLNEKARNTEGIEGYIVFTANGANKGSAKTDLFNATYTSANTTYTPLIAGNAFIVDSSTDDAIFVPVVPLEMCDYASAPAWNQHLRQMNNASIARLVNGFEFTNADCKADFRFWVDPAFGAKTTIKIWSTTCLNWYFVNHPVPGNCFVQPDPDNPAKKYVKCHLDVYDEHENPFSLNIPLGCEVTTICISAGSVVGWPDYLDGFVEIPYADIMPMTAAAGGFDPGWLQADGAFGFTYITATTGLQAAQTLLAGEHCSRCEKCAVAPPRPPAGGNPPCGCPY